MRTKLYRFLRFVSWISSVIVTNKAFQFILSTIAVLLFNRCANKSTLTRMSSHALDWRWNPVISLILPGQYGAVSTGMVPSSHKSRQSSWICTRHIEKLHHGPTFMAQARPQGVLQSQLCLLAFLLLFKNGLDIKLVYFQSRTRSLSTYITSTIFWNFMVHFFGAKLWMARNFTILQLANHFVFWSAFACKDSLASLFCISWRKLGNLFGYCAGIKLSCSLSQTTRHCPRLSRLSCMYNIYHWTVVGSSCHLFHPCNYTNMRTFQAAKIPQDGNATTVLHSCLCLLALLLFLQ